jgi:hypothetical protein
MIFKKVVRVGVLLFALPVFLPFAALTAADDDPVPPLGSFVLSDFHLRTLPAGNFFPNVLENIAPDTTMLIEESNGFSLIDNHRVYFEGDSFRDFNWRFGRFAANSALDDGSPAFLVPFSAIDSFELRSETPLDPDSGFVTRPLSADKNIFRVGASTVFPNLGGFTGLGKIAVSPHASERGGDLFSTRRQYRSQSSFDFAWQKASPRSAVLLAASYLDADRRFNDFNARDSQFDETGDLLLMMGRYARKWSASALTLSAVYNRTRRDRLFAELGRYPQETFQKQKETMFAGISYERPRLNLDASVLFERENRTPNAMNFSKNRFDNDGEGLWPFERWGRFSSAVFGLSADRTAPLRLFGGNGEIRAFARWNATLLDGNERSFEFNPVLVDRRPYLVVLWEPGSLYRNGSISLTNGLLLKAPVSSWLTLVAKALLQYQSLTFRESRESVSFLSPGYDLGFTLFEGRNPQILFSYERIPYSLRSDVRFFLEKNRPSGMVYRWEDRNHDRAFQPGESGDLFGATGGAYHEADPNMEIPSRERLLLLVSTRLSRYFRLDVKGLYKRIENQLWVRFAEEYGFFERVGLKDLYFYDRPYRDYILGNSPSAKDPFYAQFHLRLAGEKKEKWYFSFSFMAHIGMGTTAFGNGAGANDIGVIDESQADPNSRVFGYGRVDGDRAFVGRIFFGRYLGRRLFVSGQIKYRDGDPFAFLDVVGRHGQWVVTYESIKAEDEHGRKGGPREDCLWDFSFKLSYFFSLGGKRATIDLSVFNLFDFGSELSENVLSGGFRYASELQIPRSLRLGLTVGL